ncbi:hypothetical protein [Celerinatantimonas sp. YJH-8]|uniref:hypothetical protein n=1 Tax=Celerinatantimonas sp. YJH-8 TaxID=3228714 RepID=UPI0038C6E71E
MILEKLERWIDATIASYPEAIPCSCFAEEFAGYFQPDYLARCHFVITDEIPIPQMPELDSIGIRAFLSHPDRRTICYKQTYFIKSAVKDNRLLHFHELIHTYQWKLLGVWFFQRYFDEYHNFGYQNAPLERMAIEMTRHYQKRLPAIDVQSWLYGQI